ncbi:hypothetical protein D3C72_2222330 [compost metagenome]
MLTIAERDEISGFFEQGSGISHGNFVAGRLKHREIIVAVAHNGNLLGRNAIVCSQQANASAFIGILVINLNIALMGGGNNEAGYCSKPRGCFFEHLGA